MFFYLLSGDIEKCPYVGALLLVFVAAQKTLVFRRGLLMVIVGVNAAYPLGVILTFCAKCSRQGCKYARPIIVMRCYINSLILAILYYLLNR